MTKEWRRTAGRITVGILLAALVLSAAGYYFFFFREDVPFAVKEETPAKHVLFISSYSESFETVDLQKAGIREALACRNIHLDIAYMDMKNYNHQENMDLFYQTLRYKLEKTPKYDVILLGDDAALAFAENYQQELFPEIPMVFFCINNAEYALRMGENPYMTGAVEEFYLRETIDIAIKFQPKATRIVAIYDNTLTGQGDKKQFFAVEDSYPDYTFEGLSTSEYTGEELGRKLEEISDDSIVIYMTFFEDADGEKYFISESVKFLSEHTNVPVYRTSIGGVGEGLIGGKMVSYEKSGYMAAEIAMQILDGANAADIPVTTEGESQYYFDYQILKKFDIDFKLVPEGAVIVNKAQTLYEEYQTIFIPVTLFVLICIVLVLVEVTDNLKLRRLTKELRSSHRELQETYEKLVATEEELKQQYDEIETYVSYLEKKESYIRYQAEYDYLTDLPNRRTAMSTLNGLIESKSEGTVVIVDIDDFKEINDSYGHVCGDEVLKEVAARLRNLAEEKKLYVSRLGGDEFLLISREKEIQADSCVLNRIKKIFAEPIIVEEKKHYIQISMGVAYLDRDISEAGKVISNADFAMYAAKKSGKNTCIYYDSSMQEEAFQYKEIKNILSEACREDGFYVLYQPQVHADTGIIDGYEALVRLKSHSIPPIRFISVAEDTGLITTIGRIVTQKVVEQMALWRENGMKLVPVSINFSSLQIQDKGYVGYLKGLLDKYDIPSEYIEIEITESIFINNNEKAMKLFEDFKSIGVTLALDDFGTGYSSINYLTFIPVQKIKLDKSLADIFLKEGKDSFIENIIRLAHGLGLKITVEGIEEAAQCRRLREFRCDYIQGYYFSKPITGEEVELLRNPIKPCP